MASAKTMPKIATMVKGAPLIPASMGNANTPRQTVTIAIHARTISAPMDRANTTTMALHVAMEAHVRMEIAKLRAAAVAVAAVGAAAEAPAYAWADARTRARNRAMKINFAPIGQLVPMGNAVAFRATRSAVACAAAPTKNVEAARPSAVAPNGRHAITLPQFRCVGYCREMAIAARSIAVAAQPESIATLPTTACPIKT